MLICDEVKLALLVLGLGLLFVFFCKFVIGTVLLSAAVWVLIHFPDLPASSCGAKLKKPSAFGRQRSVRGKRDKSNKLH